MVAVELKADSEGLSRLFGAWLTLAGSTAVAESQSQSSSSLPATLLTGYVRTHTEYSVRMNTPSI